MKTTVTVITVCEKTEAVCQISSVCDKDSLLCCKVVMGRSPFIITCKQTRPQLSARGHECTFTHREENDSEINKSMCQLWDGKLVMTTT